ncbi:putative methyltransferase [Ferrovum sp. JA12]|uniref:site-specific DNA-methyltransferase n=1 Tax=Ferrovum sp. JA12 TaxID=1356299 RepID=UPI0007034E56|nr:site-specific DNA-methyltransferase [Ferrovum sp. JA12]KRH78439.1 putative methyltransferase [Ferrovum sp. JA12]
MEKMKMHSPNLTQDNIARIRELFPGCVTEAKGEDGVVKLAVDFDQLRQELAESIVEGPQERYHLNWPGKREALLTANAPIAKTLRPVRSESVDFDTTKNLFIEGDNLDALKLLQETYLGKVKMIYIDPPYNTGTDLLYEDDYSESNDSYRVKSNQQDEMRRKLTLNTEANGRFHSDWLSMIYSRLRLALNLLAEEGVIFISIDENEVTNLRKVCDEVFGEKNALSPFIWSLPRGINAGHISRSHEYVVGYAKDKSKLPLFNKQGDAEHSIDRCNKKVDRRHPASEISFPAGVRYEGTDQILTGELSGTESVEIVGQMVFKDGALQSAVTLKAGWTMKNMIQDWLDGKKVYDTKGQEILEFFFKENGKLYSKKRVEFESPKSILSDVPDTQIARTQIAELLGNQDIFPYPKPSALIERLVSLTTEPGDIVLDFFAGSATTAQAIFDVNVIKSPGRRFILVQLPEPLDEGNVDNAAAIEFCESIRKPANIAEISKERIRRAGKKVKKDNAQKAGGDKLDIGFRILKVDASNMAEVYYAPDALDKTNLDLFVDNIKPDRTSDDLLFQVMLDWGVDLALPITKQSIQGKDVFFVDGNVLAACFDASGSIDEAFVKELAKQQPLRVVFRDAGYKNSAVKINVEQIFKLLSPATEVKCI